MATITLNSLKCVKLQDSISEDEIEVRINGIKVGGPYGVHKGDTVQLGQSKSFTGSTTVQLVELDGNSRPDNLGIRTVDDDPVTGVNLNFDAANKAFYTVNYTVR
jgi:hypothetical protein